MKLVFMGTPAFAVPTLSRLLKTSHEIRAVYTQPPRPQGRGYEVRKSPVHLFAEENGLEVKTPPHFKEDLFIKEFQDLGLDCAVVVAYGLILPRVILAAPRLGCLNVHASLLPRWRGAAPIQRAMMAGDGETGVTIMQIEEKLDAGPFYKQVACPITDQTTSGELHDLLAEKGAEALVDVLELLEGFPPIPQDSEAVTYAPKILSAEERLNWDLSPWVLERQIRALNPWPGAWFEHQGKRIKVWKASCIALPDSLGVGANGTVVDEGLTIFCGGDSSHGLRLEVVQKEGGKPLPTEAFLKGYPLKKGMVL